MGYLPTGGINGVFLEILCPGSGVSTKSFNLTKTGEREQQI